MSGPITNKHYFCKSCHQNYKKLLLVLLILADGRGISLVQLAGFKSILKAMTLTNDTARSHLNLDVSWIVNKFLHQQPVISKAGTSLL